MDQSKGGRASARRHRKLAEIIGQRIRALRDQRAMPRTRLASKSSISLSTLNLLERGDIEPRLGTLEAVARALGVRVADLLSHEPVAPRPTAGTTIFFRIADRLRAHEGDPARMKAIEKVIRAFDGALDSALAEVSVVDRIASLGKPDRKRT